MTVNVTIDEASTPTAPGPSLFDCADELGVRVPTSCRKQGTCRECLVEVVEGSDLLSSPSEEERHLKEGFRLSCRARVAASSGTIRCRTLRRGEMRVEQEGAADLPGRLDRVDPAVTRRDGRIFIDGEPVSSWSGPLHGLAVDLGTTTVVVRLVDLESGEILGARGFENPQRFGGSDVMSRIQYDTDHGGRLLQRALTGYMTHAIEELTGEPDAIFEIVVAGNSTMRDLLFGLDVRSIGQAPYRSIAEHELLDGARVTTGLSLPARRLRLPANPAARVVGLPLISGHVGADAAACALAVGLDQEQERIVAVLDMGTNTEILVGNAHRLFVASCPAGPAFEGGLVARGMPGLEGAIESVSIAEDGSLSYAVIGGGAPKGICGSGLVDMLGELLRTGRMNDVGRLTNGDSRVVVDATHDMWLSEADVSHLAQAKAANGAGLGVVLQAFGAALDDIDVFYLAGGFARHLDIGSARRIGLVPDVPDERLRRIGNGSIEGATIALLSNSARARLETLVRRATHVELETHADFFDHFVDGCLFREMQ